MSTTQFDFGENWQNFASNALTDERVNEARKDFDSLFDGVEVRSKSFLDIGFGQGLTFMIATERGANACACDINPKCKEAAKVTAKRFNLDTDKMNVMIGSILDPAFVKDTLAKAAPDAAGYDIVHSWGVLHHTGDMDTAIRHAASLVKPGGHFILALYNRHWSSKPWLFIKWLYVHSPRFVQKLLCWGLAPVIFIAKFIVTGGQNPFTQSRGMEFYHNVIDWVGGYPYEYESIPETKQRMEKLGFTTLKAIDANVPTGCNEFVCRRNS